MPFYEITLVARPLAKTELITTFHRAVSAFLNNGAVVTEVQSLGHRDLPFRRVFKQTKEHIWIGVVNKADKVDFPEECNLAETLLPPAHRPAIKALRENQKMSQFTRMRIFKRTEKEWRAIPKSYTIAPPRE